MSDRMHDLLIIGGGPAGVGAAIQTRLYGLEVKMVGDGPLGGRLALARRVENFPVSVRGRNPTGRDVCRFWERWLKAHKIKMIGDHISQVSYSKGRFMLIGEGGRVYLSKAAIIATGAVPREWRAPGGSCPGRLVKNWRLLPRPRGACVAVIGGGETAFDQACSLAERGAKVIVLMRGAEPRAHPGLAAEAARLGVEVYSERMVDEVSCGRDGSLVLSCGTLKIYSDYVLPAVGHKPNLPKLDRSARKMRNRGLWLAGDVREKYCRQAAVAFGDGVRAAMLAWKYLRKGR